MNKDIEQFLDQYLFLPQNIKSILEGIMEYVEFEPKDYLVKTGEYSPYFYYLKSGIVRSYLLTDTGKEATRYLFTPGFFTGPVSAIMRGIPSELNYQALTNVTGYRGSLVKIKELALKHHEISLFYSKTIEAGYLRAEKVVLETATLNAEERYILLKQKMPSIDNLIAQKHIASYLNITNVQLSRIRKKLITKDF